MNNSRHTTAFYAETLLLVAVFAVVILIITRFFALGSRESAAAKNLTNAVTLAENAAEAISVSVSPEDLAKRLDEAGNARLENGQVVCHYDAGLSAAKVDDAVLTLSASWEPSPENPRLVRSQILVTDRSGAEIYRLSTAVYIKEVPV